MFYLCPIMFVRLKTTPNSPKTAVQLVENVRNGSTVRQKIVRHFGFALNEKEIAALKNLALHYKSELEEQRSPTLFAKESLMENIELGLVAGEQDRCPLLVNLRDIKEEQRICVGIHQTYGKIFDQVGYGNSLKNASRRKASVKMLLNMVMARISNPVSKRGSVELLEREYGVNLDVNSVYRMMDYLDEEAIEKVKLLSYGHVKGLLNETVNMVFYDCTTLYFESFTEDDLKQNGYSKDGKFNQSQVLLAVMVTQSGLPVGYEVFEGSKFEGHTIDKALARLHGQYKIDNVIFVADAALLSRDNIKEFRDKKQDFIVGARIKNLPAGVTKQILDKSRYRNLTEGGQEEQVLTCQEIPLEAGQLRLLVTYSERRAAKDRHDREKAIEALKKRLEKSPNPKSLLNNFGYKMFVKLEGEAKLVTDEEKIKAAQQWDGLHGIITNISQEKQSAASLLAHYKGLWQVEETFRISKHDLRMRPIFHWTPRRIHAHIAICFMALMCMRLMEYKVRLQYKKMSPAAIRNVLLQLSVSILKDYKTGKRYVLPAKATQDAKKIYQLLGRQWTDTPYQLK